MVEGFGGWVEVDVKRGAAVVLEMGDESAAEGCLGVVRSDIEGLLVSKHTFPAPAGPITRTPNLDILIAI